MKFVPTIRPAVKRDAPYLLDIDIKCYDHAWLKDDWALIWEDSDSSIHVAVVYGQPVGFVITEREDHEGKLLNHIYKLAVKEQFRGSNIGRMLLAEAYREAKEAGMGYLSIAVPMSMTLENNIRCCLGWLQKMGFKAVDTLPNNTSVWGQEEDIIIFEFEVTNANS